MTIVFLSPHPDDAALSCGGLIARLRDRGQPVTIVSRSVRTHRRRGVGPAERYWRITFR